MCEEVIKENKLNGEKENKLKSCKNVNTVKTTCVYVK